MTLQESSEKRGSWITLTVIELRHVMMKSELPTAIGLGFIAHGNQTTAAVQVLRAASCLVSWTVILQLNAAMVCTHSHSGKLFPSRTTRIKWSVNSAYVSGTATFGI